MKKLTKRNLNELAGILPVLDEIEQREILGGTDDNAMLVTATTLPYSTSTGMIIEPTGVLGDSMVYNSLSTEETYMQPCSSISSVPISTSTEVTTTGYIESFPSMTIATRQYSLEEVGWMVRAGTWKGGEVEGYGYMGEIGIVTGVIPSPTTTAVSDGVGFREVAMGAAIALFADDASGVGVLDDVLALGILAGIAIYDYCAGEGNENYPGPWVYEQPDPGSYYMYKDPTMNESGFPSDGNSKWLLPLLGLSEFANYKENIEIPYSLPPQDSTYNQPVISTPNASKK